MCLINEVLLLLFSFLFSFIFRSGLCFNKPCSESHWRVGKGGQKRQISERRARKRVILWLIHVHAFIPSPLTEEGWPFAEVEASISIKQIERKEKYPECTFRNLPVSPGEARRETWVDC